MSILAGWLELETVVDATVRNGEGERRVVRGRVVELDPLRDGRHVVLVGSMRFLVEPENLRLPGMTESLESVSRDRQGSRRAG